MPTHYVYATCCGCFGGDATSNTLITLPNQVAQSFNDASQCISVRPHRGLFKYSAMTEAKTVQDVVAECHGGGGPV